MHPNHILPIAVAQWTLRLFTDLDREAVLRLNAGARPAVAALDATALDGLLTFAGSHLVAVNSSGEVVGYALSFFRDSDFDDTEMGELRRRLLEPFLYVGQIVIAPEYRRQGLGRAFYTTIEATARSRDVRVLCCDVNTDPPNPESFAFHRRQGFMELGAGFAGDGTAIVFMIRRW